MNKTQAISRIEQTKETDEIVVATFPSNICNICNTPKNVLFVQFFADVIVESCGACSLKLQQLEHVCGDLLPEQAEQMMRRG